MNPMRMQLITAVPLDPADDPDFALASLLVVDARIAADMPYGSGTTIQIHTVRISIELTIATRPRLSLCTWRPNGR